MTSPLLFEHFDELISTPDDVEKLNRSILQLAMQGKLVEQNATDEPASETLKRILKSKEETTLPSIAQNAKVFDLPKSWEWINLGFVSENIHYGYTASADFALKDYRLLRITDIQDSRVDWESVPGCAISTEEAKKYLLKNGDILIARTGGTIGKSYLVADIEVDAVFASYLIRVLLSKEVLPEYIKVFLDSPLYWRQLTEKSKGTGQPNVNATSLSQLVFGLPPLAEQQRIVARVEELFAQTHQLAERLANSRTELDRLNESALAHLLASETSEEFNERWGFIAEHFDLLTSAPEHIAPLRQSILELAVRGKLTRRKAGDESAQELLKRIGEQKQKPVHPVKESEIPFELPSGWAWTKLNEISRLITDGTHFTPSYLYDGVPFLSVKDVSSGYLDFSNTRFISEEEHKKLTARCKPEFGDVLLTKVGTTGIALVVDTDREFSIFVSIALLKGYPNEVLPNYLSLVINSPFVKRQSDKYTMGVGNKNLVLKYIRDFLVPLPPLAEQERIVKRVEQLLGWCDALEARLMSAEEERGRLVESVLAGVGG